ncbi:MAG TPA: metal ABC transporter substrate-binding protein [Candidatus Acidoferrum sp.]|nr:metal ABC transporter substrate-binding protein [Candidatus Acidoferrum sp.]
MRLTALIMMFAAIVGCRAAETGASVVTSFLPIYCWAANVAGDKAQVDNLLPARADAHDYSFTPSDARRLNAARLVVVNGMEMEEWLGAWRRSASTADQKLVTISDAVPKDQLIEGNPHFWLDPQLACVAVSNIAASLKRIDPANAATYHSNALTYVMRLQKLDADVRDGLAGITNRALVTYHDAFPYFARRYNLDIVGVVEKVAGVNPTPRNLAALSRTIRERNVRAIFVPPNSASRLARRIADDLRVPVADLDTIEAGKLTPDAYEEAMRANLKSLQKVLK